MSKPDCVERDKGVRCKRRGTAMWSGGELGQGAGSIRVSHLLAPSTHRPMCRGLSEAQLAGPHSSKVKILSQLGIVVLSYRFGTIALRDPTEHCRRALPLIPNRHGEARVPIGELTFLRAALSWVF